MKKRILLIGIVIVVILLIGLLHFLNTSKEDYEAFFIQYARDYTIIETNDEGDIKVSIVAPDFGNIIHTIKKNDIDLEDIKIATELHPKNTKEFVFWVASEKSDEIEKKFLNHISNDLVIEGTTDREDIEDWSAE